jgi:hypothetical protein
VAQLARLLGVFGFAFALAHCSSSSDDSVCEPGRQVSCACPGATQGVQSCLGDGSGYSTCKCDDAGADGSAGSGGGGTGGTGGSGGSGGAVAGAGGGGGSAADASTSCPAGSATNISGACDLVAQDCASGLTCAVDKTDAGAYVSACLDLGAGAGQLGEACSSHSDCAAGLVCALASCTRPCCSELEAQQCGANGACDLQVTYGTGDFVQVCTFSADCTPWTNDCPAGPESDCHVSSGGKLKCSFPNYDPDGGSTLGNSCQYLNDCESSQQCDFSGGSGVCRWLCKVSDTGAPDAGALGGTPGNGGCPSGETCMAYTNPSWLGVCRP